MLGLKELSQVFGVVIWAKNDNYPFHWASYPVTVNLLHVVLFNEIHFVDSLR